MTQKSRMQPGRQLVGQFGDKGPYAASQWNELFRSFSTGREQAIRCVFANVGDHLLVGVVGTDITVSTGAGFVNGVWFDSSGNTVFTPTAPTQNRIDVIAIVQNNTAVPQTIAGLLATPLGFPNDLTDYDGQMSLPAFTARLVTVQGIEAAVPVAPSLDKDVAGLYMTPLAQYQIDNAATISDFVDLREVVTLNTGAKYLLETTNNTLASNSITFEVPSIFTSIEIEGQLVVDYGLATLAPVNLRVNADSGSNYFWITSETRVGTGLTLDDDGGAAPTNTYISIGDAITNAPGAPLPNGLRITLHNYAAQTGQSPQTAARRAVSSSLNGFRAITTSSGSWSNELDPITSIELFIDPALVGAIFDGANGCKLSVYGVI